MDVLTREVVQGDSVLTQIAFARLLEWLDDGTDSQGQTYLEMRRRLVSYFDRRNRPFADELADETFNRIGKTLETDGAIATKPPARYCYVIARFVLLEDIRRGSRTVAVDEGRTAAVIERGLMNSGVSEEVLLREKRLTCLDRCLQELKPAQRDLAIEYYRDAKRQRIDRRRGIAERLGITMNALGIRASRIRSALETCMNACCKGR
jgi:DNA-directed RNA polymerase specialized sigma24 family protein